MRTTILILLVLCLVGLSAGDGRAADLPVETTFLLAVLNGNEQVVKDLLANRVVTANTSDVFGNPALIYAVKADREPIVHLLLDAKADINAKDESGRTALMWAVAKGHKRMLECLLDKGADPDERDPVGWSAIQEAQLRRNTQFEQMLRAYSKAPVDDAEQKRLVQVVVAGAVGGLLFPLFELIEARRRTRFRKLLLYALVLPIVGTILVYAVSQSDVKLNPLIGLQIGFCAPAILRAWRNKPLTSIPGNE